MNHSPKSNSHSSVIRLYTRAVQLIWRANPALAFLSFLVVLLTGLAAPAQVWISKLIIDRTVALIGRDSAGWQTLFLPLILYVILWAFSQVSQSISLSVHELMANTVRYDVLHRITQKAASLDLAFFETPVFFDRMSLARREIVRLENMTIDLTWILPQIITGVSLLILLAQASFLFPLVLLLTALPKILLLGVFTRKHMDVSIRNIQEERMVSYLARLLGDRAAVKEIRLFQLQDHLLQRHQDTGRRYLRRRTALTLSNEAWISILTLLLVLGTGGIWGYTGWMALAGMISLGEVALIFQAVERSRAALDQISTIGSRMAGDAVYLDTLFGFLDLQPGDVEGSLTRPESKLQPLDKQLSPTGRIEFRHVTFRYPSDNQPVLHDISFHIEKGQVCALVGENGAGKTTLIKLLARLYDPTEGQILLDGRDLREYDLEEYRRQMGVIFQDFNRYDLTVRENIGLGCVEAIADIGRVRTAARLGGAEGLIENFPQGVETVLGKRFEGGVDLSGGEWQKIALSRAFMREANLLILDEPTSALDAYAESEVYDRFAELTHGKTTVFVTHRLSSVKMAQKILVLKKGRLIEAGSHEELLTKGGEYTRMFTLQAERYQ